MNTHDDLDSVTIPAGTLIHVAGYPFFLDRDTVVKGRQVNYDLAKRAYDLQVAVQGGVVTTQPGIVQPADALAAKDLPPKPAEGDRLHYDSGKQKKG